MKNRPIAASVAAALTVALLAGCGGGGGGHSSPIPTPTITPTTSPTTAPTSAPEYTAANFQCPTSDSSTAVARSGGATELTHMRVARAPRGKVSATLVAVTYGTSTGRSAQAIAQSETSLGASVVKELTFSRIGKTTHVLSVPAAKVATVMASLRTQSGVESVQQVAKRFTQGVSAPYWPNDPYFDGFQTTAQPQPSATPPPSTYEAAPYAESSDVPGQWDMHALRLEHAFGYGIAASGGSHFNANAQGSRSVKIAIIDTGADTGHPELTGGKVVYQRCFITAPQTGSTPAPQSTSNFVTDPAGHGTDVSGIAAANTGNGVGFTGTAGATSLMVYRVYPTPDTSCDNEATGDDSCSATTVDIASAIEDAVNNGANVISMSLGGENNAGQGCPSPGVDSDSTEGAAVADAIAHDVIVVAAAGNDGTASLEAPACDSGVIAVGATSLDDGQPNGAGHTGGTAANPIEYVASDYSDYGGAANPGSASAWGIVAPGGDPTTDNDTDDLHWIENLWTSTPYDTNDAGECTGDYPTDTGTPDCRTLIAGTSMATPHVAGVAALVLAVSGGTSSPYQSPTAMKQLLCQYADNINDPEQGCGRVDAYRAVAAALGDGDPGEVSP